MGSVALHLGARSAADAVRSETAEVLRSQGFAVVSVADHHAAVAASGLVRPDVVVVDGGPGIDLVATCRSLRAALGTPVVVVLRGGSLRAGAGEPDPVIAALDAGADDVIIEVGRQRELVARVRAVIRRNERTAASRSEGDAGEVYECGAIRLDDAQHVVTVAGTVVELPLRQYELLRVLIAHAGQVVHRDTLTATVWGSSLDPASKSLNVHVRRLRAHLEDDRRAPRRLVTVRGVGYRLTDGTCGLPRRRGPEIGG